MRATDGIRFIDAREAADRPETWLGAFQAAIDGGCPVSDEALACIQQHAGRFRPEAFFPTRGASRGAAAFPEAEARASTRGCPRCTTAGLLGQMLPEFKAISCRVVRDFYHKYTVDEHTLLTIRNLERLTEIAAGTRSAFPGC